MAGNSPQVTYVTVEAAINELRAKIARMERIYEMSSQDMLDALTRGKRTDTAEIAWWMIQYHDLRSLEKR